MVQSKIEKLGKQILFFVLIGGGFISFLVQTGKLDFDFGPFSKDLKKVNYVIDGDTIVLDNGETVRYLGINAPEIGQPYSSKSLELNKKLVLGKKVRLEFDIQKRDRYGRLLAYVWTDGLLVNEKLVEEGLAVSETIQPNVKYQDRIVQAQIKARENCRGIWEGLCISEEAKKDKRCVRIVRINANAPGDDNKNKNGEWIEIKNFCDSEISLNNWLLKDNSAINQYRFQEFILGPNQKVNIYSGCGENTLNKLYWQCPEKEYAVWNNTGDHAFLFDSSGKLVDDFNY